MIRASVVIPVRNEEAAIAGCLTSLLENDFPRDDYEVLVVDGMSTDRTLDILRTLDWKGVSHDVIPNPRRIVPVAMNLGIQRARGKYLIRLDAHTTYAEDYLSKCVELLERGVADNVGGPMRVIAHTPMQEAVKLATGSRFGVGNAAFHFEKFEGYADTVYLGAFRREVFDEVGGFDEELVRNQDDEFNFRLRLAGKRIYVSPAIRSWYTPRSSLSALWRQYYQYGYWKVRVIAKHGRPASFRHLIPGGFVAALALSGLFAPFVPVIRWLFFLGSGCYLAALSGFSLFASRPAFPQARLLLPVAFATLHFSYGAGFLWAILRHSFRR